MVQDNQKNIEACKIQAFEAGWYTQSAFVHFEKIIMCLIICDDDLQY